MESGYGLRALKEDYREIQEKFDLPLFKDMNEEFGIEKISESEILTREVRRYISEKIGNYFRLIEALLNPVNVQMFVYKVVKSLGESEKEKLKEIYGEISKMELELIELDLEFSETKEIDFIKNYFNMWQNVKKDLLKILGDIKSNWDNKSESKSKNYFG